MNIKIRSAFHGITRTLRVTLGHYLSADQAKRLKCGMRDCKCPEFVVITQGIALNRESDGRILVSTQEAEI